MLQRGDGAAAAEEDEVGGLIDLRRLSVERQDAVARIVLSGDPLDLRETRELCLAAREVREDRGVRVVVLSSHGGDFCSGPAADLDPLGCGYDPPAELAELRVPVVADLRGSVSSVGLEIALCADIRIAWPGATFSMPDVAAGRLPCWGGTQRLPRAAGRSTATRMLLLGASLDAAAAVSCGLVHEVGDGARVDEVVSALCALGPIGLQFAKEAVLRGSEKPMHEALQFEGDLNHLLQASADRAEGIAAFLQKREPRFEGR